METLLNKKRLDNYYAEDNIPCIVTDNINDLIKSLKKAFIGLFQWLDDNPVSANPIKWSNTLKQFLASSRRIVWVCLTILWGWRLEGQIKGLLLIIFNNWS